MGLGWHPIYEMENNTCLKPPTREWHLPMIGAWQRKTTISLDRRMRWKRKMKNNTIKKWKPIYFVRTQSVAVRFSELKETSAGHLERARRVLPIIRIGSSINQITNSTCNLNNSVHCAKPPRGIPPGPIKFPLVNSFFSLPMEIQLVSNNWILGMKKDVST